MNDNHWNNLTHREKIIWCAAFFEGEVEGARARASGRANGDQEAVFDRRAEAVGGSNRDGRRAGLSRLIFQGEVGADDDCNDQRRVGVRGDREAEHVTVDRNVDVVEMGR